MIAWINLAVLLIASFAFLLSYVRSVSPAGLEKTLGPRAFPLCFRLRMVSSLFEMLTVVCYVIYLFYPLPVPLPASFPWSWWISGLVAALIAIPALLLMGIGLRDAGEEAMRPRKEHVMYGGIYTRLRHPQAVGEVFIWLVIAFLLNSPFLVIFSLIYFPIFVLLCWAEDQDLLLRYGEPFASYMRETGAFWPKRKRNHA
jgi:protein-S-isoprenylcysteine O-methyltransferase Ste14